jgi:ribosomal protein S18 acetylase RimI-like enzyme
VNVSVRAATDDDVAAILLLWRDADAVVSTTDDEEAVRGVLARDADSLLLAVAGGQVIGTLIVGWDGWRANLYRLAVLPGWRRRGVARTLVEAGEARLLELGARRVAAVAISEHEHATGFWRSMGYEPDERLLRFARML